MLSGAIFSLGSLFICLILLVFKLCVEIMRSVARDSGDHLWLGMSGKPIDIRSRVNRR